MHQHTHDNDDQLMHAQRGAVVAAPMHEQWLGEKRERLSSGMQGVSAAIAHSR